jgi:aminoglycoside 6'-N-acetyltransferase I
VSLVQIVDLGPEDEARIHQTAALPVEGFREQAPDSWPTLESALAEVRESFAPDRVSRVAIADDGTVVGWVGAISQYGGRVWELHPLVVAPAVQRQGIGRALVTDLESVLRARGAQTLWLGSDDETGQTSLANVDLYDDLPRKLAGIENLGGHPYEFYQRLGFTIVGVMPDANGVGRPDIFLAKRIAQAPRPAGRGADG